MATVEVTIVVVSFNTRELLRECLSSIEQTAGNLRYEVIVVDNASSDDSPSVVAAEFPEARLICNDRNVGFAQANNQAIRVSRGRYVLLLNSDAQLLAGTLQHLVTFLDEHPEAGMVGGQLLNPDGSFQGSFADFPTLRGEILLLLKLAPLVYSPVYPSYSQAQSQHERAVDWVSGACLMVRRSAIDVVGLLDERYFMYTEETDWCYRMRRAGWLVFYTPSARTIHWSGQSSHKVPEQRRVRVYQSKYRFMHKYYGRLTAGMLSLAIRVTSVLKLGMWAARCMAPNRVARERAITQVRSYVVVLSHL
jgi:N-acetylglucosaminyl-diphospho-decaprenol L-rhamnosyltransferase